MKEIVTCASFALHTKPNSNGTIVVQFTLFSKLEEADLETATNAFDTALRDAPPFVLKIEHCPEVDSDIAPPDVNTFLWIVRFVISRAAVLDDALMGICLHLRKVDDVVRTAMNTFHLLNPKRDQWTLEVTDDATKARAIVKRMIADRHSSDRPASGGGRPARQ